MNGFSYSSSGSSRLLHGTSIHSLLATVKTACRELQIHASAEHSERVMVRNQCQHEGSVRMSQIHFKKQPWPYAACTQLHNVYSLFFFQRLMSLQSCSAVCCKQRWRTQQSINIYSGGKLRMFRDGLLILMLKAPHSDAINHLCPCCFCCSSAHGKQGVFSS